MGARGGAAGAAAGLDPGGPAALCGERQPASARLGSAGGGGGSPGPAPHRACAPSEA